ncbi:kinase, partial [Nocardia sp. NPDC049190]
MILYGGPATGKDSITAALSTIDTRFRLFERLKVGPGRTRGYRMTTPEVLADLEASGDAIWANERYGARYVIDRPGLLEMFTAGLIPVVHAGQTGVIPAIREALPNTRWMVV